MTVQDNPESIAYELFAGEAPTARIYRNRFALVSVGVIYSGSCFLPVLYRLSDGKLFEEPEEQVNPQSLRRPKLTAAFLGFRQLISGLAPDLAPGKGLLFEDLRYAGPKQPRDWLGQVEAYEHNFALLAEGIRRCAADALRGDSARFDRVRDELRRQNA